MPFLELLGTYSKERVLSNNFEFIENELDIRTESIKSHLELVKLKLFRKIDKLKLNTKTTLDENKRVLINILLDQNQQRKTLKNKREQLADLIRFSKSFEAIHLKEKNLCSIKSKAQMTSELTKQNVGYLKAPFYFNNLSKELNISIRILDLRAYIKSACGIAELFNRSYSNSYKLALTDFASNQIKLIDKYDSYLMSEIQIRSVDKVKEKRLKGIYALCVDTDTNQSLFACDMELQRILVFDAKLEKIKRIIVGTREKVEFECPRDICYFNKHIYVLDQGTNSLDKFFVDSTSFVESFYFNKPTNLIKNAWSACVCTNTIAIIDWKEKIFLFSEEYSLRSVIELKDVVSMCMFNDRRLKSDPVSLWFHCENANLVGFQMNSLETNKEPIKIYENSFKSLKYRSEFMLNCSSQRFIISFGWAKALALIEFC